MEKQCFCNNVWTLGFPKFTYTRPMAEHYCVIAIAKLIGQFVFFLEGKFHCCTWFSYIFFSASPIIFPSACLGDHILCLDL